MQTTSRVKAKNAVGAFKFGELLEVVNADGCSLEKGELCVVLDPDQHPLEKRRFLRKVGFGGDAGFVLVGPVVRGKGVGFYACIRFRRASGWGEA